MNSILYFIIYRRKASANKNAWLKSCLMKSMLWHKLNKGLSSTLNWMTKYILNIYFQSQSAHSPTFCVCLPKKAGNHFISGKELHYKYLGHRTRFLLFISLTLPATLGRDASFPIWNRERSPLFYRKAITSIFLTGFSARSSWALTRKSLKTEPLPYTF